MKIRWVWFFPILIIKTNWFVTKAALSLGLIILIKPRAWDNEAMLAHELTHSREALKRLLIFYALMYWLSDSFRLKMEVMAYRVQLSYYLDQGEEYYALLRAVSRSLANGYGLDISEEEAYELLDIKR